MIRGDHSRKHSVEALEKIKICKKILKRISERKIFYLTAYEISCDWKNIVFFVFGIMITYVFIIIQLKKKVYSKNICQGAIYSVAMHNLRKSLEKLKKLLKFWRSSANKNYLTSQHRNSCDWTKILFSRSFEHWQFFSFVLYNGKKLNVF